VDLGATEFEVRGAMHRAGTVLLEQLLNSDHGGHAGQRLACGRGHHAEFIVCWFPRNGVIHGAFFSG